MLQDKVLENAMSKFENFWYRGTVFHLASITFLNLYTNEEGRIPGPHLKN
jgi:hypothetical protein